MIESTRSPLSWSPLENNRISSAGSAVYRYDDANRCGRLAREAQECFTRIRRDELAPSKKVNFWGMCLAIDLVILFGAAEFHKRMPAYRRFSSCIFIGAVFFLVVCLPMLICAGRELDKVQQRENPIYQQAANLILTIKRRLDAFVDIFPENIIQEGELRDIEVTEELKNSLDQWIDSLRMVHGWDQLAQHWNPPERSFIASKANDRRYIVNETFKRYRSTYHLVEVIHKIEEFRASIIRILSTQTEQERDTAVMTRVSKGLLRELIGLIYYNMKQERKGILSDLKSLNRAYRERQEQERYDRW